MTTFAPFTDFETASREVLVFLHGRMGFGLWMMTRAQQADWLVLHLQKQAFSIEEGDVLPGASSLCTRVIDGRLPFIVANCRADTRDLGEAAAQFDIGAYISVPVWRNDGTLFGTLCAIDPDPQPQAIVDELPYVQLLARLLASLLESEQLADERARELGATVDIAMHDELTHALNRRGWNHRFAFERERVKAFGSHTCLIVIDLDDLKAVNDHNGHAAGDELLERTARCLRGALRSSDVLARMGGDEFAVLIAECDDQAADRILHALREALAREAIAASLGMALARSVDQLDAALARADETMYADKAARRGGTDL